jgi:hypothetical protein
MEYDALKCNRSHCFQHLLFVVYTILIEILVSIIIIAAVVNVLLLLLTYFNYGLFIILGEYAV